MGEKAEAEASAAGWRKSALESLFEEHHEAVFLAAYRLTGSVVDAEDVLQTVFLRLLSHSDFAFLKGNSGAYLRRAAVNAAVDLLRKRKSAPAPLDRLPEKATRSAKDEREVPIEKQMLRQWLRVSLSRMSPREAEIFSLRFLEGYRNLEIAAMLETAESTIAVTIHRLRSRLKNEAAELLGERQ